MSVLQRSDLQHADALRVLQNFLACPDGMGFFVSVPGDRDRRSVCLDRVHDRPLELRLDLRLVEIVQDLEVAAVEHVVRQNVVPGIGRGTVVGISALFAGMVFIISHPQTVPRIVHTFRYTVNCKRGEASSRGGVLMLLFIEITGVYFSLLARLVYLSFYAVVMALTIWPIRLVRRLIRKEASR